VLNFISHWIAFRRSQQPSIMGKGFLVDASLHCDLQGYMDEFRLRLFGTAVESKVSNIAH
jgi:hypothetical protein